MKTRTSLLAAATLLIGLSAVGQAHAGNATHRADANAPHADSYRMAATTQSAASSGDRGYVTPRRDNETNAVTVRPYGSHNDGYRTSQGWWKDD